MTRKTVGTRYFSVMKTSRNERFIIFLVIFREKQGITIRYYVDVKKWQESKSLLTILPNSCYIYSVENPRSLA